MRINRKFKPLYTSLKRYFFLTGGRGSLKSTTVHDFVSRLTYERGHGILFTRFTMASAQKSIIPEFRIALERNGSLNDFHITNEKVINKDTGSFILFSGIKTNQGDQTANLKSLAGITTWIIEEAEDFNDQQKFEDIDDSIRTASIQNRVILIMNPTTREHWAYKKWIEGHSKKIKVQGYDVTVSDHPDVEHIHTSYHIAEEMGYLSDSFINKALSYKESNEEYYKHKYIGGWLERLEGCILTNWSVGNFDESLPFIYGMDFGYTNDPTVLVKVAIDEGNKKLYLKTLFYEPHLSTEDIINKLEEYCERDEKIVADRQEARLIDEIREEGFNIHECVKGPDSVRKGILDLQSYHIIVDPEDDYAEIELNHYIWNDKRAGVPVDKYNHIIDAVRYALQDFNEQPTYNFY